MRYFLIINQLSRGGKSRQLFPKIFKYLNENNITYEYKIIKTIEEAYSLSAKANKNGWDVIVAVGGDGTINAVINGFYDNEGRVLSNARFGVIYAGTSPDFCKSYNIPVSLQPALKALFNNRGRKIPVVRLKCCNHKTETNESIDNIKNSITKYYACCANIGLGAELARRANSGIRKRWGDTLGTLWSLIQTLKNYKQSEINILADNIPKTITKFINLSVGRTRYIASGIKYHHTLATDDKRLYCIYARDFNVFNLPLVLFKVYSGYKYKNRPYLYSEYVNQIEVFNNPTNSEVEMDGDPVGFLPCKIEVAKDELFAITL